MNAPFRLLSRLPLLVALLAAGAWPAAAQGIVVDPPASVVAPRESRVWRHPVRLVSHTVKVRVTDQVARTDVVQVFRNTGPRGVEGVYLFPLPAGAAVSDFTMSMEGKQVSGEVLDARRARAIYLSIVQRRKDPGLLEFAGRGCIRARLFPIPARGETRITLSFTQILAADAGLVELTLPLRSDRFAPGPVRIVGEFDVTAGAGVATLFSPSHALDVVRKSATRMVASFEETRSAANRDLRVLYGLGQRAFGASLATTRQAGEDGHFVLLLAPNVEQNPSAVLPKDIVFVVDTSGSMGDRGGVKLRQAKAALGYALGRLGPRDRFNVVAFATAARPFRDGLVAATRENIDAAVGWTGALVATGGTAIHAALTQALRLPRDEGRVPLVVFLTDGQPTIGPADQRSILAAAGQANTAAARLFVFGVGDDVNASLLTGLAENNRGATQFVREREDIEQKVSALVDKVAAPVLTDVTVSFGEAGVYDVYPRRVGDLFKGQQAVVVGRYRSGGARKLTLRGRIGSKSVEHVYDVTWSSQPRADARGADLRRLWAVRKVGFLLGEIRRNGENAELVAAVRKLGVRHGIVTPYTSFLVLEERELRERDGLRPTGSPRPDAARQSDDADFAEARDAREALRARKESGRGAVAGARIATDLAKAKSSGKATGRGVRHAGGKTFRWREGVWVDASLAAYQAAHPTATLRRVIWLSDAYLKLLADDAVARILSVGTAVRFVHGNVSYEVVPG